MKVGRELIPWRTPFNALNSLQREMSELVTRFFGEGEQAGAPWTSMGAGYVPQIESRVQDQTLYVKADLPGIDPQDVEVTVEGNCLTLRGERKTEHEGKDGNYVHREVHYGSFARSVPLPEGVKAEDVKATYGNGVLELAIPLPASLVPKKVPIAVEPPTNGQEQSGATK